MTDPIKSAVLASLGAHPTPSQREDLAQQLRALADEQERLAAAQRRQQPAPRAPAAPGPRGGRPRGSGARVVVVEDAVTGKGGRGGRISIGRGLWPLDNPPRRLDPQRIGATLELRPCDPPHGYAVIDRPGAMPRIGIGQEALDTLRLSPGRYSAGWRGGVLVLTRALT